MKSPADLLALLHGEFSSLIIEFNHEHACNYSTAQRFSDEYGEYSGDDEDRISWVSPEEREKALRENSVWTIQWYPATPIGFCCVGASTFEAACEYALRSSEEAAQAAARAETQRKIGQALGLE